LRRKKARKEDESSIQLPALEERTGHSFCPLRELGEEQEQEQEEEEEQQQQEEEELGILFVL
jgi:hypothetical protein